MFPREKRSLFSTAPPGRGPPCSWPPTGIATLPASSLKSAHAVRSRTAAGSCPEMGEVPGRTPEGRKDRKEGCLTRCLDPCELAPVRVLTLPREFLPSLSPHLPLLSVPRFPAQGAEPPGRGQRCVYRLRGGAPRQAVGSPVRRPHHQEHSTLGGGVPGAAVWRPPLLPGAGKREDLPGALLSPGEAVPVPPPSGEKSLLQEGVCHM